MVEWGSQPELLLYVHVLIHSLLVRPVWEQQHCPPAHPHHLRLASRPDSGWALSADWVLDTEDTLELRTKPKAASLAAGRRE